MRKNISTKKLNRDKIDIELELKESIKNKLENLCELIGSLRYNVVSVPKRALDNNLLTQKLVFNELANKIIIPNYKYTEVTFLKAIINNYYMLDREFLEEDILNKYLSNMDIVRKLDNMNKDEGDLYFIGDTIYDSQIIRRNQQFINEVYDKIKSAEKLNTDEVLTAIDSVGVYKEKALLIEIIKDNQVLEITDEMVFNVHKYFSCFVIRYAIENNLPIPYVDLTEATSGSEEDILKMLKFGGIKDKGITRIEYITNPHKGLFTRVFTPQELWYMTSGEILSNKDILLSN